MIAKRLLPAGVILAFMSAFFSPPAWAEKMRGPKLLLKQTVFDFNEVTEGTAISHHFCVF